MRPTSDRVREALFARLGDLGDAAVLDLYAGTGALGIEAISRGASRAVFVERAKACVSVLRANLEALELNELTQVLVGDVPAMVRRLGATGSRFDLVLLDPPYASSEISRALPVLVSTGVLAPGATVVAESRRCDSISVPPELSLLDQRSYGDTHVTRYVLATADMGPGGSVEV